MSTDRSSKLVLSLISLWVLASLTCIPNVGVLRMCRKYSTSCPGVMWLCLEAICHDVLAKQALRHFKQICDEGLEINNAAFVSLLSACSHASRGDGGVCYFESMSSVYGISATVEHYICMVDLLGSAGCLREAEDFINTISCEPNASVWMALLGDCRVHGNVEMGERIAK